jgi:Nuclease-related domain
MSASSSLRGRVPGQLAMSEIVAAQQTTPTRSRLARVFGTSPLRPTARPLYRAALGELLVGDTLDNLGPEWDVLHVVPVDANGRDIDHLVIGPPGVFSLSTQNMLGDEVWVGGETLLVDNKPRDDIATTRRLAEIASALLSAAAGRTVTVDPILVVVNPKKLVLREQPSGLVVVSSKQLLRWLKNLERTLPGEDVAYISDVADRDSTWHTAATLPEDTPALHRDFAVLREEVRGATRRRIAWSAIAFAILCGAIWVSTVLIVEQLLGH